LKRGQETREVSLGGVAWEEERKPSWAKDLEGSSTTGGGSESPRKPTSETQGHKAFLRSRLHRRTENTYLTKHALAKFKS